MTKSEFYHEAQSTAVGPLAGIIVLEACTTYAGPVAAAELADMGAEVIKCELPVTGDICRTLAPRVPRAPDLDRSAPFLSINRNKKAITLNLHHPRGQELFGQLARRANIVLENFRPGTMEGWHLGYADIRTVKSEGSSGWPLRHRAMSLEGEGLGGPHPFLLLAPQGKRPKNR